MRTELRKRSSTLSRRTRDKRPAHGWLRRLIGRLRPLPATSPDGSCPSCGVIGIHRAKTQGSIGKARKQMSGKRPYRCDRCGWNGWLHPLEAPDRSFTVDKPPNLVAIDRALDDAGAAARRSRGDKKK
jgi:predicted RNA-binding Zn-ribbon protein involved in translation (DUF1610 family)